MRYCQSCGYPIREGQCSGCGLRPTGPAPPTYRYREPESTKGVIHSLGLREVDFLKQRGLTQDEIREWVRLEGEGSYVFLPIETGFQTGYHGRALFNNQPKYISVGMSGEEVWRVERVLPGSDVYVCEGVFDAYYFSEVVGVAILRGSVTQLQAEKVLTRLPARVILGCDRDADPDEFGGWFRRLDKRIPIERALPPRKDWGDEVQAGRRFTT